MNTLAQETIDAHGGLDRWVSFTSVQARLTQGGALWGLKGKAGVLEHVQVAVDLRNQWASHFPFGQSGRRSIFTTDSIAIQTDDGAVIESSGRPRQMFDGHTLETPWTDLQLAFFAGCAMWTYLNVPFVLAWPNVESEEIEPWTERQESWRRLRVRFPDDLEVFSKEQTLYIGDDGLLRRMDYNVEIAGNTPGAHYVSGYTEASGIKFPTKRRIFPRQPDGHSLADPLVISIDLDEIELR